MVVNQVYELLNSISKQAYGENTHEVLNVSDLVSLGDTVLSSQDNKDLFLNTLIDRIGRTILRTLDLSTSFPNIMRDSFEFGGVLQKITIEPMEADEFTPSKVGESDFVNTQFDINKPTVRQSLFSGSNGWSINVTIPDKLFESAFTNASTMARFIEGIIDSMNSSMTLKVNQLNRMCVNTFIAHKINSGRNVVHLLTEFNSTFNPSTALTLDSALVTPEFFRFTAMRMKEIIGYMSEPSIIFNEEGVVRETQRDNMHVFINNAFGARFSAYLESDTFHKELVSLPYYDEVKFWQSMVGGNASTINTMPSVVNSTTLNITVKDTTSEVSNATKTINQSGIIGLFADREAIGTTIYKPRVSTDRNNKDEYTNYSNKMDVGYYNDLSENGCVFVID